MLVFNGVTISTLNNAAFSQIAFDFKCHAVSSCRRASSGRTTLGLVGGLFPAVRAARLPITVGVARRMSCGLSGCDRQIAHGFLIADARPLTACYRATRARSAAFAAPTHARSMPLRPNRGPHNRFGRAGTWCGLTIPMFLGISSMMLASMIDTIYIGWIGTHELAAVSFSFPVVMGLSSVSMGLGVGATSVMARTLGSGDREAATLLGTHTLVLVAILVTVLAPSALAVRSPVLRLARRRCRHAAAGRRLHARVVHRLAAVRAADGVDVDAACARRRAHARRVDGRRVRRCRS